MQGDLPPQQILADVERHRVTLAHERHPAPGSRAADRLGARVRVARAVHRRLGAVATGEIVNRPHGIGLARVERVLGAQLARQRQALG